MLVLHLQGGLGTVLCSMEISKVPALCASYYYSVVSSTLLFRTTDLCVLPNQKKLHAERGHVLAPQRPCRPVPQTRVLVPNQAHQPRIGGRGSNPE